MKKVLTFGLFLIFATTFAYAQPRLVIEGGDTYDWGNTPPKVLHAKIKLYNNGDKPLYISEVKPSCGCTSAPLDKNTVQPGEYATMKVNLTVSNQDNGKMKKFVKIYSNDPKKPEREMILKCNVVKPIIIKPTSYLSFKDAQVGMVSSTELTVYNKTKQTVTFSNYELTEGLQINWKDNFKIKPGSKALLIVKYIPSSEGYQGLRIKMKSTCKEMEWVTISGGAKASQPAYLGF